MTALSQDKEVNKKTGDVVYYLVAASTVIYKGALVMINSAGYAVPAADGSGNLIAGIAAETGDNSASATDGAVGLRVYKNGNYEFNKASAAQTDVGVQAYVVDDQTVGASSTNSVKAGVIVECVSSTKVRVQIDRDVY